MKLLNRFDLTPNSAVALQVRDVSYRTTGGKMLIHPLSLSLEAGERMAIVGPNGAGKSTLLRLLGGLLAPSSGGVLLGNKPLAAMSCLARAREVAILGQLDHADVRLVVRDYVALGCLPHRHLHSPQCLNALTAQALSMCNLETLSSRGMGSLSGGERQRAHLARALAQQPKLLLLDEPTNHLDPRATLDLLGIVRDLGITVVAVLHNLPLVPPWADQVAVLNAGALVRYGSPTQTLNPVTVHQVFAMHSYYLPHPQGDQPIFVLDSKPSATTSGSGKSSGLRTSFFNHYVELTS